MSVFSIPHSVATRCCSSICSGSTPIPAVYIMILPGMGVVSELVTCFSRKRIFGYGFVAAASLAIAVFGFLVWGHHMFVSGQSVYAGMIFSLLSYRSRDSVRNQSVQLDCDAYTKVRSRMTRRCSMPLDSSDCLRLAGLTGLFVAALGIGRARTRYLLRGCAFPLHHGGRHGDGVSGRYAFLVAQDHRPVVSRRLGAASPRCLVFAGFNLTFFPQFVLGYLGMPRSYHAYPPEFQVLNVMSTAGASILAIGYLTADDLYAVVFAVRQDRRAESVGGRRSGMADVFTAAHREFHQNTRRD